MLFLHSTHHHAEVLGFEDNSNAFGFQYAFQSITDLLSQALLRLEPAREHVDDPGDLAEADNVFVRHISDVHFADEGEEMVFTEAVALDIGDDHHAIGFAWKERAVDNGLKVFAVTLRQKLKGFRCALGGFQKPFALGVFADGLEERMEELVHNSIIKRCL
ncbi:MAG: hypothetical protein Greene101449_1191 [Candidatus Peregrinibacteria bacterium Greene1014_49]|nr:MAG: hypothetical protein Greene101449_1191 [Candidatus Peregrinibacteria bacterium Greene1014_49]